MIKLVVQMRRRANWAQSLLASALGQLVTSAQAPPMDPVPSTDVLPGLAVREPILTTLPCHFAALFRPRAVHTTI